MGRSDRVCIISLVASPANFSVEIVSSMLSKCGEAATISEVFELPPSAFAVDETVILLTLSLHSY